MAELSIDIDPKASEPLVQQLQRELRTQIHQRALRPGQKLPSMRQFAAECGVSLGIVKQAINTLTAQGYLRAAPGSGVYVAQREIEQQAVALVVPAMNSSIAEILSGVREGLQVGGPRIFIQDADFDFNNEAALIDRLDSALVSGAIIYPPPTAEFVQVLQKLTERGVPYVLVDTAFDALEVDSVTTDSHAMGLQAMQHLLDRGHRHIGLIDLSADSSSWVAIREGMGGALTECGLRFEDMPRFVTDAADLNPVQPWSNGEKATVRLLGQHPELTAIIGMNDNLALGALRGVRSSGRWVPDDISVFAIGDLPVFAATDPALTAIGQPNREMGRVAASRLLEVLREGPGPYQSIKLKPSLFERDSVRPVPQTSKQKVLV